MISNNDDTFLGGGTGRLRAAESESTLEANCSVD